LSQIALIAEPSPPVAGVLRKILGGAGFEPVVVATVEEALAKAAGKEPVLVFASALFLAGSHLCQELKRIYPNLPVVLLYPPEDEDPEAHATKAGADAFLVGPLKRAGVLSCARTMVRIRTLNERLVKMEADPASKPSSPRRRTGEFAIDVPNQDFEFFKKLLLMEVKRSRRYRYPVSFLLVGIDKLSVPAPELSESERKALQNQVREVVTKALRDIDLCVTFTEGRLLVFLPHTPKEGARTVAGRLREKVSSLKAQQEITGSVGVASYEPKTHEGEVNFGSLMREATDALRRAQEAGGNRVDSGAKSKRDRISMG
jgi:diguanylate cyclase (GGDEF)-like protein